MYIRTKKSPRVALIHYWLVGMRGGEKVLESLCRLFPHADIYTHVAIRKNLSPFLRSRRIFETNIAQYPFSRRFYQSYLPLMPRALEALDLRGYDLVISSESGPAKGVVAPPDAPHLCYCHSPMRYLWDQYHVYREQSGFIGRSMMPVFAPSLRNWDVSSAARVDAFAANSNHVAARIKKYWRRDADVVAPPVDVQSFQPAEKGDIGDYYLWVGDLAPYKRPDLVLQAFKTMNLPLHVVGGSSAQIRGLSKLAGPKTKFLGRLAQGDLQRELAHCRALVFPGEEDFGIVPVEAQAAGRPVIAYGRGGVLDTVIEDETGILFDAPTTDGLIDAIDRFNRSGLADAPTAQFTQNAVRFDERNFHSGIMATLGKLGYDHVSQDFPLPVAAASD